MQRKRNTIQDMKTAILPQIRVEPQLRAEVEAVLREGESLSEFIEATVRGDVEYRRAQAEFHERGEAAWRQYRRSGESYPASQIVSELRDMLEARRRNLQARAPEK